MGAGRPRKPVHIKKAQGTLEKSREIDNPVTFDSLSDVPEIPVIVPNEGRDYFVFCCELLLSIRLLTAAFIPDITRAAIWYGYMVQAVNQMAEDKYYQETKTGYTAINSHLTTYEKAHKYLSDFENKYGFNLVSSQRLSMPDKKRESEYFD